MITNTSRTRFSVIVPCFNEEGAVETTVRELLRDLAGESRFEIIVVNDGSTDLSLELLEGLQTEFQILTVVSHDRNRGYGAALKTGIRIANGDLIVITDGDGTYPNDRIPDLIALSDKAHMVVGSRTGSNVVHSRIRMLPKFFLRSYASWIAGHHIPDINSGLRVFRKDIVERFIRILPDTFSFTMTITLAMLTNNYQVHFEPIDYAPRVGKSKIRPIRDTLHFIQLIVRTGTYFAPLRVFGPVCLTLVLLFIASASYDVFWLRNLTDKTVLLLLLALNTLMFALLADMIDKRANR